MSLIDDILKYRKVAIVGTSKNTGKTVCLNYILTHLPSNAMVITTSIGVDGERVDAVTQTDKPEVALNSGTIFATSESHYRQRRLVSNIIRLTNTSSSLGRLVTAQVEYRGEVQLSGPSTTDDLCKWMSSVRPLSGSGLFLIDGAASRLSSASPFVTDAFILCTGAAAFHNIETLVKSTNEIVHLSQLPVYEAVATDKILYVKSFSESLPYSQDWNTIVIEGAFVDNFAKLLIHQNVRNTKIVVKDFTKFFVSPQNMSYLISKGCTFYVEREAHLIAVCVNPTSPRGFKLDFNEIQSKLKLKMSVPVIDLYNYDDN